MKIDEIEVEIVGEIDPSCWPRPFRAGSARSAFPRAAPICILCDAVWPGSGNPSDGVEGPDFSLGVEGMRNIDAEIMNRWAELLRTRTTVLEAHGAQVMAEIRTALGRLIETGPALEQTEPYARGALLGDLARNARNLAASTDAMARFAQLISSTASVDQTKVEP